MHILAIIDELEIGGSQRQILELGCGLLSMGIRFSVIYFREGKDTYVQTFEHNGIFPICVRKNSKLDRMFIRNLIVNIKDINPDVAITYNPSADVWGSLAAWKAKVPKIVTCIRNVDVVKENRFLKYVYRFIRWIPSIYISNSKIGVSDFREHISVPKSKFRVVYNGLNIKDMKVEKEYINKLIKEIDIKNEIPILISVGRLVQDKGHDILFKALRILKEENINFRCIIVGDGPLRKSLETLVKNIGISDYVLFLGERRDIYSLLSLADIFVLSSRREGLSNAVIEALCMGLPVICSRVGGNPELIQDGLNGFMFETGKYTEMAEKIKILLSDSSICKKMGEEAIKTRNWIDSNKMTERFLDALQI